MSAPEKPAEKHAPLDLSAIRARCEAATPGPLRITGFAGDPDDPLEWGVVMGTGRIVSGDGFFLERADAELFVRARADLLALLAEVERLSAQVKRDAPALAALDVWSMYEQTDVEPGLRRALSDAACERRRAPFGSRGS